MKIINLIKSVLACAAFLFVACDNKDNNGVQVSNDLETVEKIQNLSSQLESEIYQLDAERTEENLEKSFATAAKMCSLWKEYIIPKLSDEALVDIPNYSEPARVRMQDLSYGIAMSKNSTVHYNENCSLTLVLNAYYTLQVNDYDQPCELRLMDDIRMKTLILTFPDLEAAFTSLHKVLDEDANSVTVNH